MKKLVSLRAEGKSEIMLNSPNTIRLFMLPFAGASMYSYRGLENELSDAILSHPLELPGRGRRFTEPLLTNVFDAVDDLFGGVRRFLYEPYALFGHSMGAVLAFLISCKATELGYPPPLHIFCSGRSHLWNNNPERWYQLASQPFWQKLQDLGGLPGDTAINEEIRTIFEPILRADLEMVQSVEEQEARKKYVLNAPITVLLGRDDQITCVPNSWQRNTPRTINTVYMDGDHFYFMARPAELAAYIIRTLTNHVHL